MMANLKAKKVETVETNVEVENTVEVAQEVEQEQVENTTVEIQEPEVKVEPEIEVVPEVVTESEKPVAEVRIRMRVNHTCTIGDRTYDLKQGQCYNVPEGVKKRLNKAGLLSPL